MSKQRFCWRRRKRHRFRDTNAFRIAGGPFNRGRVLICKDCGHETIAVGPRPERLLELGSRDA